MRILKNSLLITCCLVATILGAEPSFVAKDLGTLATDKSEARSLNAQGWVAGKFVADHQTSDFLWTPDTGLFVIASETSSYAYPKLNDQGDVFGYREKPGTWFSAPKFQLYHFTPEKELKPGKSWQANKYGFSVVAVNDIFRVICDDDDLFEASYFAIVGNGKTMTLQGRLSDEDGYVSAMNNKSQLLVTYESPGLFGSRWLSTSDLFIYDLLTEEWIEIANDRVYYGAGLNDQGVLIARDKQGKEGFYGSKELGMKSLGDFLPVAINNHNDIVGKKNKEVLLRKSDGTMIDLNKSVDFQGLNVEKITQVWAINDRGQIVVTARIAGKPHTLILNSR